MVEADAAVLRATLRYLQASPEVLSEMASQCDRLLGTNLLRKGTVLDLMVDDACHRLEGDFIVFLAFLKDLVVDRLPRDAWAEIAEQEAQL